MASKLIKSNSTERTKRRRAAQDRNEPGGAFKKMVAGIGGKKVPAKKTAVPSPTRKLPRTKYRLPKLTTKADPGKATGPSTRRRKPTLSKPGPSQGHPPGGLRRKPSTGMQMTRPASKPVKKAAKKAVSAAKKTVKAAAKTVKAAVKKGGTQAWTGAGASDKRYEAGTRSKVTVKTSASKKKRPAKRRVGTSQRLA
jgi:hypothetical protein